MCVLLLTSCIYCLCPPVFSYFCCSFVTDKPEYEEERADTWRPNSETFVVNGQVTAHNPWAANSNLVDIDRYRQAQARLKAKREAAAAAAATSEPADGSSST